MESSNIESKLLNGLQYTKQLIDTMKQQSSLNHNNKSTAKDLLVKIMEVLDVTISTLSTSKSSSSMHSDDVDSGEVFSTLLEEPKYEDSSIFTISSSPSVDFLDRRVCKKPRTQERFVKESTTLVDDGHAWRKYGQKIIRDSNHPREYFRCTNKFDQGCRASKHVQKLQNGTLKYRTIYFGQHTCKNLLTQNQNIFCVDNNINKDDYDNRSSSVLFSFESSTTSTTTKDEKMPTFFPTLSSPIENVDIGIEERSQNVLSDDFSPSSSYLSPLDMTVVSDEFEMPIMSMLLTSDFYGDMIMAQSGNLDVEMNNMVPLNYFDDVF